MNIVVLDVETTGLNVARDEVIQVGFAHIEWDGRETVSHGLRGYWTVRPACAMSPSAERVHRVSKESLACSPAFETIAPALFRVLEGRSVVGHRAATFDVPILRRQLATCGLAWDPEVFDTYLLAKRAGVPRGERSLRALCSRFGVPYDEGRAHDALYDVRITWAVLGALRQDPAPVVPGVEGSPADVAALGR